MYISGSDELWKEIKLYLHEERKKTISALSYLLPPLALCLTVQLAWFYSRYGVQEGEVFSTLISITLNVAIWVRVFQWLCQEWKLWVQSRSYHKRLLKVFSLKYMVKNDIVVLTDSGTNASFIWVPYKEVASELSLIARLYYAIKNKEYTDKYFCV